MKRLLPVLLALLLALTGCQSQNTEPEHSTPPTSSDAASLPDQEPVDAPEELLPDNHTASKTPSTPSNGGPGTLPFVPEHSASQPAASSALPDTKPLTAQYTSTVPAKQSWAKAYETFYSGITTDTPVVNPFSDEAVVRDGLVFPIYSYADVCSREDLLAFADHALKQGGSGSAMEQSLAQYGRLGAVMELPDGSYYGEALGQLSDGTPQLGQFMPRTQGDYSDRYSMTITEGVENQLLERGFDPATTTARALFIEGYTTGTFFRDGEKCCFLNQTVGIPVHGVLQSGRIYTMQELAGDIQTRIDEIEPLPDSCRDDAPIEMTKPNPDTAKPVIYLYPERETVATVKLDYQGAFTYTYPTYHDGWEVTAYPDGRLVNRTDGSEHYYLFWEGNEPVDWDQSKGFVVKGSDSEAFLREKLAYLG